MNVSDIFVKYSKQETNPLAEVNCYNTKAHALQLFTLSDIKPQLNPK